MLYVCSIRWLLPTVLVASRKGDQWTSAAATGSLQQLGQQGSLHLPAGAHVLLPRKTPAVLWSGMKLT